MDAMPCRIRTIAGARLRRALSMLLLVLSAYLGNAVAQEAGGAPQISDVRLLRKLGQFDQALEHVRIMLADEATPEEIRRQAYDELVTILYLTKGRKEGESAAQKALTAYPDLQADPNHYPGEVLLLFENMRKEMFGRLSLASDPSPGDVYLDGKKIGVTPLDSTYVSVGQHAVRVVEYGYEDGAMKIDVPAGAAIDRFVTLRRARNVSGMGLGVEFGPALETIAVNGASDQLFAGQWDLREYSAALRFGGGVFLHLNRQDRLAGQLGIRYSSQGGCGSYDATYYYAAGEYDVRLDYVSVYMLAKYYVSRRPRLYVAAGPEFGYLIKGSLSKTTGIGSIDIADLIQRQQAGLVFGAGFEKSLGRIRLMLSSYYSMALIGMRKSTQAEAIDFKPREWRLSIGFMVDTGRGDRRS
jgi:hypothetical protein